jgi:hypothetical protein
MVTTLIYVYMIYDCCTIRVKIVCCKEGHIPPFWSSMGVYAYTLWPTRCHIHTKLDDVVCGTRSLGCFYANEAVFCWEDNAMAVVYMVNINFK